MRFIRLSERPGILAGQGLPTISLEEKWSSRTISNFFLGGSHLKPNGSINKFNGII